MGSAGPVGRGGEEFGLEEVGGGRERGLAGAGPLRGRGLAGRGRVGGPHGSAHFLWRSGRAEVRQLLSAWALLSPRSLTSRRPDPVCPLLPPPPPPPPAMGRAPGGPAAGR